MKKKFPILTLLIIAVVFSSCQQNPEPVEQTFTDGKIKVTNNVNRTVYLKLAAIDSTKNENEDGYREIVSDTTELLQGKTKYLDFDFSKFRDKKVQVMFSSNNDTNYNNWDLLDIVFHIVSIIILQNIQLNL